MSERRRLPVLSNTPPPEAGDDEGEERPPLHWVGFGTVAIFAAWLPLAYVAGAVSSRVMTSRFGGDASQEAIALGVAAMDPGGRARLMATVALPGLAALAIAAFGGGFVVGRFGDRTGTREAALSGVACAIVTSILAWSGVTLTAVAGVIVTALVAVGFAAWGGRFGLRRRPH